MKNGDLKRFFGKTSLGPNDFVRLNEEGKLPEDIGGGGLKGHKLTIDQGDYEGGEEYMFAYYTGNGEFVMVNAQEITFPLVVENVISLFDLVESGYEIDLDDDGIALRFNGVDAIKFELYSDATFRLQAKE